MGVTKGDVFNYLFVIAVLSLSLLNQGWGVPKHYLVETKDGDNNVVGTQDDDAYVVGTQENLARIHQDAFNEAGSDHRCPDCDWGWMPAWMQQQFMKNHLN